MKKLFAFLLISIMVFSLVACGGKESGGDNDAGGGNDNKLTSSDDKTAGQQENNQESTESGNEEGTGNKDWPFDDIPAWPGTEKLRYSESTGIVEVKGDESILVAWESSLKEAGIGGYFDGEFGEYFSEKYYIMVTAAGADYDYNIDVMEEEHTMGMPDAIVGLFPEYNGDGVILLSGDSEPDSGMYYFYTFGETEAGAQRYIDSLLAAGFAPKDASAEGVSGEYIKTADGKELSYWCNDDVYWGSYSEDAGIGNGSFWLEIDE